MPQVTYNGQYGQVDFGGSEYQEATSWSMEVTAKTDSWHPFGGGGWEKASAGPKKATGTISGKQDFNDLANAQAMAGDSVALTLSETTTGSGRASAAAWTVPAIITSYSPNVDGDAGGEVSWTLNFESNGAVTEPT